MLFDWSWPVSPAECATVESGFPQSAVIRSSRFTCTTKRYYTYWTFGLVEFAQINFTNSATTGKWDRWPCRCKTAHSLIQKPLHGSIIHFIPALTKCLQWRLCTQQHASLKKVLPYILYVTSSRNKCQQAGCSPSSRWHPPNFLSSCAFILHKPLAEAKSHSVIGANLSSVTNRDNTGLEVVLFFFCFFLNNTMLYIHMRQSQYRLSPFLSWIFILKCMTAK